MKLFCLLAPSTSPNYFHGSIVTTVHSFNVEYLTDAALLRSAQCSIRRPFWMGQFRSICEFWVADFYEHIMKFLKLPNQRKVAKLVFSHVYFYHLFTLFWLEKNRNFCYTNIF